MAVQSPAQTGVPIPEPPAPGEERWVDRETGDREIALNRKAWELIGPAVQREHVGMYVALANGKLIAAVPTFQEAAAAVKRLQPVPVISFIFPAEKGPVFEPFLDLHG